MVPSSNTRRKLLPNSLSSPLKFPLPSWLAFAPLCLFLHFHCVFVLQGKDAVRAQWFKTAKNQDICNGPLASPFARLLTLLTHPLAPHCLLCSRAPLRSLIRLLTHFAHSRARGTENVRMAIHFVVFGQRPRRGRCPLK